MKRMIVAASLALALAACTQQREAGNDAASQLASDQATRDYITRAEADWAALATRRDPQVLERILAKDYAGVSDDGTVRNKAQEIAYWNTLPLDAAASSPKTILRQFGDTVLFRDGQWQVVGSQNAVVAPKG